MIVKNNDMNDNMVRNDIGDDIKNIFNQNNDGVEFTLEKLDHNGLPFLDIKINKEDAKWGYEWYNKPHQSGNCMKADAFMSERTKKNFIRNRMENAMESCNTSESIHDAITKITKMLINNGYKNNDITHGIIQATRRFNDKTRERRNKNEFLESIKEKCLLKGPYLEENLNRELEDIARKQGLEIKAINGRASRIVDIAKPKPNVKKRDCQKTVCRVCNILGEKYSCQNRNLVYCMECGNCEEKYIGKTDNTIEARYYQHRMGFNRRDTKNPLTRHVNEKHQNMDLDMNNWKLSILEKGNGDPVVTALKEAHCIEKKKPEINKRRECRTLFEVKQ